MTVLNPITWGKANLNSVIAGAVGGVVFWLFGLLKFSIVFGLQFAIAVIVVLFVRDALHAMASPTAN